MNENIYTRGKVPRAGEKVSARAFRNIARGVNSARLQFGGEANGIASSGGGSVFVRRPIATGSGGKKELHPYEAVNISDARDFKVKIQLGTHNGEVPKVDDVPLDADIEENQFFIYPDETVCFVKIEYNNQYGLMITNLTIDFSESVPQNEYNYDNLTGIQYQPLFFFNINEQARTVALSSAVWGSQWFQRCGDSFIFGLV